MPFFPLATGHLSYGCQLLKLVHGGWRGGRGRREPKKPLLSPSEGFLGGDLGSPSLPLPSPPAPLVGPPKSTPRDRDDSPALKRRHELGSLGSGSVGLWSADLRRSGSPTGGAEGKEGERDGWPGPPPSGALLPTFLVGGGFPYENRLQMKGYPYYNLFIFTGGPRCWVQKDVFLAPDGLPLQKRKGRKPAVQIYPGGRTF